MPASPRACRPAARLLSCLALVVSFPPARAVAIAAPQPAAAPIFPKLPTIVIDPGHGGPDSGALNCQLRFAGRRCMQEKDVTLDISLRAERLLQAQGFSVTLTRATDAAVNHPARNIATWNKHKGTYHFGVDGKIDVTDELQARTNIADCNQKYGCPQGTPVYADAFVSLHENSCGPGCNASGSMSFSWRHPGSSRLAQLILQQVASRIGLPDRGSQRVPYYVLRRSETPAALLESAFISSLHDARLLRHASFRAKIAQGVVAGLERFLCTIVGTPGRDTITGTAGSDVICAGGGNDTIRASGGNDVVLGGPGTDTISFTNSSGGVTVDLASARGTVQTPNGSQRVSAVEDAIGSPFDDHLTGSAGANRIEGGAGSDTISGLDGDDVLRGGAGNDTIDGGTGRDSCTQGPGTGSVTNCER